MACLHAYTYIRTYIHTYIHTYMHVRHFSHSGTIVCESVSLTSDSQPSAYSFKLHCVLFSYVYRGCVRRAREVG